MLQCSAFFVQTHTIKPRNGARLGSEQQAIDVLGKTPIYKVHTIYHPQPRESRTATGSAAQNRWRMPNWMPSTAPPGAGTFFAIGAAALREKLAPASFDRWA